MNSNMIEKVESSLWFPEPTKEDDSIAGRGEGPFAWLGRSTSVRARECRRFLNHNIAAVPSDWQPKLHQHFETREWQSVFFEMVVGRTLQILGASIEVEVPVAGTNKHPDFKAIFPDGTVTVEATVPKLNRVIARKITANEDLIKTIEELIPDGWSIHAWRLPQIGPNDSKRKFKKTIGNIFAKLPPATTPNLGSMRIEVDSGFDGELALTLKPERRGRAVPVRGMAVGPDDAEQRIVAAVVRKKRQVKKANTPVLLAISTSPSGDLEDYDRALFGLTYEEVDLNGNLVSEGFKPVGILGQSRRQQPTIAGVLAYTEVGFSRASDPVLFMHPSFSGSLPEALTRLQVRSLDNNGISVRPAQIKNVLVDMNFVRVR